ncbi:MAG: glycosyltransferase, partial [Muribaculaceae bacterium]|nr:glycosyltransferase [Muribaculaceae bacterium]
MKIAYTISGLFNSGGMENILTQKASYLADRLGYDVTIITTDQKGRESYFPLSDKVKRVDLGVNYCDFKDSKLWQIKKEQLKKVHRARLSEVLDAEKFDVCISLMDFDFDFLYKINDGSRKIIETHFSRYAKVLATPNRLMQFAQRVRTLSWKNRIRKYDRFVVLTHEDKAQWGDLPNIEVIPNFINTSPTNFASQDSKKIISVGRMDYQKGYDMLLNAWKIAQKKL